MKKNKLTQEQYEAIDKKLVQALFTFQYNNQPFWTLLAMRMHRQPVDDLGTIDVVVGSKKVVLRYDPEYVEKAEMSKLRYHITHEGVHLIYRHMFRFAYSADVVDLASLKKDVPSTTKPVMPIKASDLAADLVANRDVCSLFRDFEKYGVTPSDVPNFNLSDFASMKSEEVEKYIVDTYTEVRIPQSKEGQGQGGGQGQGQGSGQGEGEEQKQGQGGGQGKDGKPTQVNGKDVNNHTPGTTEAEDELTSRIKKGMVEEMVSQAANQAGEKAKGSLPAGLQEELELIKRPPRKDWKALLSSLVKCSIPADSMRTWSRRNRKCELIKGKRPRRVPLIGVAVDTSGSVSEKELSAFLEEIDHIRKVNGSDIDIVECDSQISKVVHLTTRQSMPKAVFGRGGTEFVPALEWFDKASRKPDVVVFFTDLAVCDGDVPTKPRAYELLWVGTNATQCDHFQSIGAYGKFIPMILEPEEWS